MRKRANADSAPVPGNEDWEGVSAGVKAEIEKELNVSLESENCEQIAKAVERIGIHNNPIQAATDALKDIGLNPKEAEHGEAYWKFALRLRTRLQTPDAKTRRKKPAKLKLVQPDQAPEAAAKAAADGEASAAPEDWWPRVARQIPLDRHNIDAETDKDWQPDAEA
jgi:hypothetical protein